MASCSRSCEEVPKPKCFDDEMYVKEKRLMGPGPSNPPERVLHALSKPIMGHLHPETLKIMDDVKEGMKYLFQTRNPVTLCVSASGHGGMEASLCNLIETGDIVLCAVTGLWGRRAGDMATRYGADVRYIEAGNDPGDIITIERLTSYFEVHHPKILFVTHGDSSTGVLQPLEGIGALCRRFDCLLIVDTVASLGGTKFCMDAWEVDVVYTGSQKVLGAPPGLTPISFGPRALKCVMDRSTLVPVYYWDIMLLADYWNCFGKPRIYHHTISTTLLYGLREALAEACNEGLNAMIERHQDTSAYLQAGLKRLGVELSVRHQANAMTTITAVKVPKGVDWKAVIDYAVNKHAIEISGGLGPTAGQIFRIGTMGENSKREYVDRVLQVLDEAFKLAVSSKL